MSDVDQVFEKYGANIVKDATAMIEQDIHDIFGGEMQFVHSGESLGEPVEAAKPLKAATVAIKRELGSSTPEVPRVRFGALLGSLQSEPGGLFGTVSMQGEDEKLEYQMETRPFFGISAPVLKDIEAAAKHQVEQLIAELNGMTLPTQRVAA